jgi:hypothetical protein
MDWSAFWKKLVFGKAKPALAPTPTSTALAVVEPKPPPGAPYRAVLEPVLMYNMQGGEDLDYFLLQEFKEKSRRRARRYFEGKEVKHRVTHRSRDVIEFEFNRAGDPNHVPGSSVRIRWTNKSHEHAVDA